jgi:hypothetical protein
MIKSEIDRKAEETTERRQMSRDLLSILQPRSDLRPIDILTGEIEVEVTGVVGVSPPCSILGT